MLSLCLLYLEIGAEEGLGVEEETLVKWQGNNKALKMLLIGTRSRKPNPSLQMRALRLRKVK